MKKRFLPITAKMTRAYLSVALTAFGLSAAAQLDPNTAPKVPVDRFSPEAGTLMVRDASNGLPAANAAINFDKGPFITKGLGPNGELVEYYNFDVQPTSPAPIYVLIRTGETSPVSGQLNIIDVKPGDAGYNDFWHVHMVTVPANYVANTVTSMEDITTGGFSMQATNTLVNCPVVPFGSTATKRLNNADASLTRGWYKDSVVYYFNFVEKALSVTGTNMVPISPIYVTFNINPGQAGGGPPSGFVTEAGSDQTHNVIATLPADATYSPLWRVNIYDNADFASVMDLTSATNANILAMGAADVNCPVVSINPVNSINPTENFEISSVYPNPAVNILTVDLVAETTSNATVTVENVLGEVFTVPELSNSGTEISLDVSQLSRGMYFISIHSNGNTATQRFIKN